MNWLRGYDDIVERDVPLADLTWFRLGGTARLVAQPNSVDQLAGLMERALERDVPVKVLGRGANVLVRDSGFDGLVIRLNDDSLTRFEIDGERVIAGAGADLMKLVQACSRAGLAGLEGLAGIPGTVGGAIRMNAGGRFGEISDCVETVDVVQPDGSGRTIQKDQVGFGYRRTALGDAIVTGTTFRLNRDEPVRVYRQFKECWQIKKEAQPLADHSAGCVFTNPPGESAGRLIDRAGLKGRASGGARVSQRHANFIVADRGATATDVLRLIDQIRQTVSEQFGTELQLELDIW